MTQPCCSTKTISKTSSQQPKNTNPITWSSPSRGLCPFRISFKAKSQPPPQRSSGECGGFADQRDHEAAVKVQKVYKGYRIRRSLADCAVVVEELWWKAIDFAALKHSSVSFYKDDKPETVTSRWNRARTRVAKVGKGLSKDEKAQKLALQHWLEAIDPRHRYGHNLLMYYDCPRTNLQKQCIKYLGPTEREAYEVVIRDGKLVYKLSGVPVTTVEGSKWIFVLSTSRAFYVGEKKKGVFQHSSFLSGAAITAAGRLVSRYGVLEADLALQRPLPPDRGEFQGVHRIPGGAQR
ncbi:hypothetical protein MLD38_014276 [Melastoma candidum]|uniref:Uncharacterized protein n=1 Tax=Melastoma candidum TaxID=119954 RepID=A0ACB9RC90_9MYRT|nr:hypothetical protein MLD38_014276 [Melastoma candidum]